MFSQTSNDLKRKLLHDDLRQAQESVKDLQRKEQQAKQEDQGETNAIQVTEAKLQDMEADLRKRQAELEKLEEEVQTTRVGVKTAKEKYEENQAKRQRLVTELEEAKDIEGCRFELLLEHDERIAIAEDTEYA